jgi:hypothetical protein
VERQLALLLEQGDPQSRPLSQLGRDRDTRDPTPDDGDIGLHADNHARSGVLPVAVQVHGDAVRAVHVASVLPARRQPVAW